MGKKEKRTLIMNRVVSFLAGGLIVFAVMSFTVVNSANAENAELSKALDTSQFEAGRLLDDAKAQLSTGDYTEAEASLTALLARVEQESVAAELRAEFDEDRAKFESELEATINEAWEKALSDVRVEWSQEQTS